MKDIKLDFINKKMLNETVDDQQRISQQIKVAVRSWKADFFINTDFGINYDDSWGDMLLMKSYISDQIREIEGVFGINSISISRKKDSQNRTFFEINAEVRLKNTSVNILEFIEE